MTPPISYLYYESFIKNNVKYIINLAWVYFPP